jgi:hypoxanthine phosphoribosyltransferase
LYETNIQPKFTAEAIQKRVTELGTEIRRDAGDSEILLIGILKGASIFLSDLLRAIDGPVRYDFVDVVRDESDSGPAALEIDFLAHVEMRGRNVYLLKDVVATGVIENYLLNQFRAKEPGSLKLVALLDRPDLRTVQLDVEFRAFVASAGIYVGYGLEHHGRHGNLPYIGIV